MAALPLPLSQLPLPRWFGAHPLGRIERSMSFEPGRFVVVAEASERRMQRRSFQLPLEPADKAASELPPLAATSHSDTLAGAQVWLGALAGEPVSLFATHAEAATELWRWDEDGAHSLAQLGGSQSVWLTGKSCPDHGSVSFGSERELRVARLRADAPLESWPALTLGLTDVIQERDPSHDRVQHVCVGRDRVLLLARDAKDALHVIACAPGAACSQRVLANNVQSFAAEARDDSVLVAFAGAKNTAQIRLLTLDAAGVETKAERVPSACWAPRGGLCGTPTLQRVGQRVLLGAREGTDLMLLESADEGVSWEPLRGLKRLH